MTTHRANLPRHESKCVASTTRCDRTEHCARHCVAYMQGRPITDYSLSGYYWFASSCAGFLPLDYHGPEATKKVHEAPKGIC